MKYILFINLHQEALEYKDVDMYVAERGWQDWMNDFGSVQNIEKIHEILTSIYKLAHSSLKENRESRKISRVGFASIYNIPIRTVEAWEGGQNKMPDYTKMMIDYTFCMNDLME